MLPFIHFSQEVKEAFANNLPIVALESTIISHGMPYPQNYETAKQVEQMVRNNGATPATICLMDGKVLVGMSEKQIQILAQAGPSQVEKVSRRDLSVILSQKKMGATTVAATMMICEIVGIKVFATGGIGGVHRGAELNFDISADLEELAQTPVCVICAGIKAILDVPKTLEYLETKGVPVWGYQTKKLPLFYTREGQYRVDHCFNDLKSVAETLTIKWTISNRGGALLTNPVPQANSLDPNVMEKGIDEALAQATKKGIKGKEITPFLLAKVKELTGGKSLESNIALILNNAKVAAQLAQQMKK